MTTICLTNIHLSDRLLSKQIVNCSITVESVNTEINWMECVLRNINCDE